MGNPLIAVEHRHREQNRAELPRTEEQSGGLRGRRQNHRDPVTLLDAETAEQVGRLARERLKFTPVDLADGPVEVLVDHRQRVRLRAITDVGGDVVPARHVPAMTDAEILVAIFRLDHARLLARSRPDLRIRVRGDSADGR